MSISYRLEKVVADDIWDAFVKESENGTIFSYSHYLNALDNQYGLYFCYQQQELRAAVAVMEDEIGENAILHDFIIYNGIMFGKPRNQQNYAQKLSEQFKITSFIAEELPKLYNDVHISLHPSVVDIRPFLWVNYGTQKPKYLPDIRYTSYVSIVDFKDANKLEDINIYNSAAKSRRQEIRYAINKGVYTREIFDANRFVDFYHQTIKRQGNDVAEKKLTEMSHLLLNLYEKNLGKMFCSYTADGIEASMSFFVFDNKRAYYLFGANEPNMRDTHTGTAVIWDAFKILSKKGITEVDLEGINSPYRGWFKLSFGGSIEPYYELKFIKN